MSIADAALVSSLDRYDAIQPISSARPIRPPLKSPRSRTSGVFAESADNGGLGRGVCEDKLPDAPAAECHLSYRAPELSSSVMTAIVRGSPSIWLCPWSVSLPSSARQRPRTSTATRSCSSRRPTPEEYAPGFGPRVVQLTRDFAPGFRGAAADWRRADSAADPKLAARSGCKGPSGVPAPAREAYTACHQYFRKHHVRDQRSRLRALPDAARPAWSEMSKERRPSGDRNRRLGQQGTKTGRPDATRAGGRPGAASGGHWLASSSEAACCLLETARKFWNLLRGWQGIRMVGPGGVEVSPGRHPVESEDSGEGSDGRWPGRAMTAPSSRRDLMFNF